MYVVLGGPDVPPLESGATAAFSAPTRRSEGVGREQGAYRRLGLRQLALKVQLEQGIDFFAIKGFRGQPGNRQVVDAV